MGCHHSTSDVFVWEIAALCTVVLTAHGWSGCQCEAPCPFFPHVIRIVATYSSVRIQNTLSIAKPESQPPQSSPFVQAAVSMIQAALAVTRNASAVVFPTSTTYSAAFPDGLLVATFLCYTTCHPVLHASFVLVMVKGYLHIVFCPFAAIQTSFRSIPCQTQSAFQLLFLHFH